MLETALISFLIGAGLAAPPPPTYRIEREPVPGGAELVTLFGRQRSPEPDATGLEIPVLSVLRDTLGASEPGADRLRYLWILTSTRPTPLQRAASAAFFLRFRAGSKDHADQVPSPLLDLATPAKTVWPHLAADGVQALQLDALGAAVRSSTRSYRENSSDYRKLQVFRALGALEALERQPGTQTVLPAEQRREIYSRLSLSDRTFGGLVRHKNLARFYDRELSRLAGTRAHNWELLRQRAEAEGLYFEPLALPGHPVTQALVWIARDDLDPSGGRRFDSQFLGIANPWCDPRLPAWTGYTETRYFDSEHRPVAASTPGARALELIPLALYSLDYPRVPLLLVDFRNDLNPKRREMLHHGVNSIVTGVLGITGFGNWPYLAASTAWNFVRGRHGAPTDRTARLRSYAEAREFLAADSSLHPALRVELLRRVDHLALNPLENALENEARVAADQHAALLRYAAAPQGLEARLARDRHKELDAYTHSRGSRMLAALGGLFRPRTVHDDGGAEARLRSDLEARRRAATQVRYLEQLLASSPRPEVVSDPGEIRRVIEALSSESMLDARAPRLIAEVFARTADFGVRMACLRSLRRSDVEEAKAQLWKLSHDPQTSDAWRAISLALVSDAADTASVAAAAGGQP